MFVVSVCSVSIAGNTLAPPEGDTETFSAPHSLTLADTLPPSPRSLKLVAEGDRERIERPEVDEESAEVASSYDEIDATD